MHRQANCTHGCTATTAPTNNSTRHSSATLIQAIPVFLKVTAGLLRQTLDKQQKDKTPMMVDGEKVMGGGLPRTWYALFLDLMTQAVIEAYLCDGQVGMESIVSVFSYGYMDDDNEDEPEEEDPDDQDSEDDDDDDDDSLSAADHHLLFPKTRSMFLFKTQILERQQEVRGRRNHGQTTYFFFSSFSLSVLAQAYKNTFSRWQSSTPWSFSIKASATLYK